MFQGGGLLPVADVRPFVDAILPLARSLPATTTALNQAAGPQTTAFRVIEGFVNELAYQPPGNAHSFLYWLAWFGHNANSVVSTQDPNGAVIRGLTLFSCTSLTAEPAVAAIVKAALGPAGRAPEAGGAPRDHPPPAPLRDGRRRPVRPGLRGADHLRGTQFGGELPNYPKGYRFHASFTQASQLVARADVRMAGVNVGRVVAVRPRGLRADATIELDARYAPLASDARAILRQKTLLGETFVALTPGSAGAPKLPEGGRLADSRIASTQQLDTVLGSFDAPTQRNLRRMLQGFSTALAGRGSDLNSALGNLDPAAGAFADVAAILDRQRGSFKRVVRDTGVVLQTLGDRRTGLARLVDSGDRVLSATAARNRELTALVRALPPFLGQLRPTLRVLDTTGRHAAPTLAALRPAAPLLRPALSELIALSPAIRGLMRDIGPSSRCRNGRCRPRRSWSPRRARSSTSFRPPPTR